jgi:hypothetical protein
MSKQEASTGYDSTTETKGVASNLGSVSNGNATIVGATASSSSSLDIYISITIVISKRVRKGNTKRLDIACITNDMVSMLAFAIFNRMVVIIITDNTWCFSVQSCGCVVLVVLVIII